MNKLKIVKDVILEGLEREYIFEVIVPLMRKYDFLYINGIFVKGATAGLMKNGVAPRVLKDVYRGQKIEVTINIQRYASRLSRKCLTTEMLPFLKYSTYSPRMVELLKNIWEKEKRISKIIELMTAAGFTITKTQVYKYAKMFDEELEAE